MKTGRLHIITDIYLQSRYTHTALARMALDAGAPVVQFREKKMLAALREAELSAILRLPRRADQKIIVNDDVVLAQKLGADGAHVGAEDMPPARAIERMGAEALIGVTVHNHAELLALQGFDIAYIGVGPVYGSASKQGLPRALGLDGLRSLCEVSPFPVIAIGGITPQNAPDVIKAGAYGVAVLSYFCTHKNPGNAVREFLEVLP